MSVVYAVTWTTFVDDYKLRGQDPSTAYGPFLFSSRDKANTFLAHQLWLILKEDHEICCPEMREYLKELGLDAYFDFSNEKKSQLKDGHVDDLDVMSDIVKKFCKGEYVPCQLDFEVCEKMVDELVDEPWISYKRFKMTLKE